LAIFSVVMAQLVVVRLGWRGGVIGSAADIATLFHRRLQQRNIREYSGSISNAIRADFDADNQSTLALHLVTRHGRATPLIWLTVDRDELKNRRNDFENFRLVPDPRGRSNLRLPQIENFQNFLLPPGSPRRCFEWENEKSYMNAQGTFIQTNIGIAKFLFL
jgi:hypothetical protein